MSLHLESDGGGRGIVVVGGGGGDGRGRRPQGRQDVLGQYHLEADLLGLGEAISSYSVRITITPTTLATTLPT